jgi:hypothetical protein
MSKDSLEMRAEDCFLRYAFPCAYVLHQRGDISREQLNSLKMCLYSSKEVPRDDLQVFNLAIERIERYSGREDIWDVEVIRNYFRNGHNLDIDNGDGNYANYEKEFRDLCKVYRGAVVKEIDLKGRHFVEVICGDRRVKAFNDLVRAKKGDVVYVHHNQVVELE